MPATVRPQEARFYRQAHSWRVLLTLALGLCVGSLVTPPARAGVRGGELGTTASGVDAWQAARAMGLGINIGNTLDNTTTWETGWGNPPVTKEYIQALASYGFRTVRVPVAWDTYAADGRISEDKLRRVAEIVDWVLGSGMYCVVNIHWDGGWIDSDDKRGFARTFATFTPEAQQKFRSYWQQIATYLADRGDKLVLESLNEESNFEGTGSPEQAQATLGRVNQLFVDTVRATGGGNARRLLIIAGYKTDIDKTTSGLFILPKDSAPHRLLLSVHYYAPWTFAGLEKDASWGKVQPQWGSDADRAALERSFDTLKAYCLKNDLPAFIGEFSVTHKREAASRQRWMLAVARAAWSRDMVPVLWETGQDVQRHAPYYPDKVLRDTLLELFSAQPAAGAH